MKRNRFHEMSNHTLVGRFVELALGQDEADLVRTIAGTIDYSGKEVQWRKNSSGARAMRAGHSSDFTIIPIRKCGRRPLTPPWPWSRKPRGRCFTLAIAPEAAKGDASIGCGLARVSASGAPACRCVTLTAAFSSRPKRSGKWSEPHRSDGAGARRSAPRASNPCGSRREPT